MANTVANNQGEADRRAGRRAWLAVSMLSILYMVSLLDRQIFLLLIGPLKSAFSLSDIQIGLLVGTAFATVYALLGVSAGRIADSGNRKMLIVAGVFIWCLSTIASGFATTYAALIALRLGLAAGEAVLTPAAHSMIGDLFPPEKRSLPASIYMAAGLGGAPLAFSGGARVMEAVEHVLQTTQSSYQVWQVVLVAVGVPGLLLGVLFAFLVKEPLRTGGSKGESPVSNSDVIRQILSRKKLYSGLFLGATLVSGASYAVNYWAVETLRRDFEWTAVQAGSAFGPIILVAGVGGALLAPWIGRRLRARGRSDAVVVVSIGFTLVAMIALALGPTQPRAWLRLALLCVGVTGALGAASNIVTAMQEIAPARMRGTFVALLFMMMTLLGGGIVPVVVPTISELLSSQGGALSKAMIFVCVALSGSGLLMFWWVKGTYELEARAGLPTAVRE